MSNSTLITTPEDVYCCILYNDCKSIFGENKLTARSFYTQPQKNLIINQMKDAYTLLNTQKMLSPSRSSIDIILEYSRRTHSPQLETQM